MRVWYQTLADLLVNLAAGWFGSIVVVPAFAGGTQIDWWLLLFDATAGILSLKVAVIVRNKIEYV